MKIVEDIGEKEIKKIQANFKKQRKEENLPNVTPEMRKEMWGMAKDIEIDAFRLMRLLKKGDEKETSIPLYAERMAMYATRLYNMSQDLRYKPKE